MSSRQAEAIPARAGQRFVGCGVFGELFTNRIPAQGAIQFARDVGQVADRHGAMAGFDGGVQIRARVDRVEPILQMRASDMAASFPLVDCGGVRAV